MTVLAPPPLAADPPVVAEPPAPRRARWTDGRWFLLAIGAMVLLRMASLAGVLASGQEKDESILGGDARRYGQMVTSTGTPYADFAVEYPPLVLGSIKLIYTTDPFETLVRLGVSQLLLDLCIAAVLGWGFGRRAVLSYLALGLVFLPYPLHYMRLDLLSVFLAACGWALLRRRHQLGGGALLAVSVFAKLWPLALAPVMIVERRIKGLVAWAVTGAAGAAAWYLWAGPEGMIQVVSFRGATGWQVESLPGIVLHMWDHDRTNFAQGAWRTGTMPGWSRSLFTLLSVGFTALAWWWARPSPRPDPDTDGNAIDDETAVMARYGLAAVVSVTAFLVFSSIISPQYTVWLLPFCALACLDAPWRYGPPSVAIFGLSALGLAVIKSQPSGDLYATVPVLLRNLALVWLLAVTMVDLYRIAPRPVTPPTDP